MNLSSRKPTFASMVKRVVSLNEERSFTRGYWSARENTPVPVGFVVPKAVPRDNRVEQIFEYVRKRDFPHRPSRLNAVYVCPSLVGFCDPKHNNVYEVDIDGKTFLTDGEYFTSAIFDARLNHLDRLEGWATSYWKGRVMFAPEIIVHGKVTVIGKAR